MNRKQRELVDEGYAIMRSQQQAIAHLNQQVESLRMEVKSKEREVANLTTTLFSRTRRCEGLAKSLESSELEKEKYQRVYAKSAQAVKSLREDVETERNTSELLRRKCSGLEQDEQERLRELGGLERQVSVSERNIVRLEARVAELVDEKRVLKLDLDEARNDVENLKLRLYEAKGVIEGMTLRMADPARDKKIDSKKVLAAQAQIARVSKPGVSNEARLKGLEDAKAVLGELPAKLEVELQRLRG